VAADATYEERLSELEATTRTLAADNESLRAQNEKLADERERYRALYQQTLETCKKLERGLLGQKAERLPENEAQLTLQILEALVGEKREKRDAREEEEQPGDPEPKPRRRKPTGRKPLPETLPVVEIEVIPEDVQRGGLDAYERIGEEVCDVIERRPASLVRVRVRRPKFVRKDRSKTSADVSIGEPLELPIERGLAGPGLLADSIVRRWQDHLPLNRLESIYAREGLRLARSTLCGWHEQLRDLVAPLVEAMWQDAFQSPYLCTDATGVLVQAKERCRRGHFWVVIAPERHVLYRFSPKHDSQAVDRLLAGYQGYLVADAHAVYDHLYTDEKIVEVGCWAHLRRYFFKALTSDPERARAGLAPIQGLFGIEREIASLSRRKRYEARLERAKPLAEKFFAWCEAERDAVLDETPIAKAIGYGLNQRGALLRFLEDGRLPLHNNGSELALRRQAVGRKNWLFVGSDQAADVNTAFVSLLASCQIQGIEPWTYLRDLFSLLPRWPRKRVLELAPVHWNETLEQEDTQRRLASDLYRWVTLEDSISFD